MIITLNLVRETLKQAFGFNSFIASFISDVREDSGHPTAGITKEGVIFYNPEFVAKYVSSKKDLFSLIFHELLHPMFGHFVFSMNDLENIAADAIINAIISGLYWIESQAGFLFQRLYKNKGLEGLLRRNSSMDNSRYYRVYQRLYPVYRTKEAALSTGELIQTLKILTPKTEMVEITLLGTHGKPKDFDGKDKLSEEVKAKIAEELQKNLQERVSNHAGYSQQLVNLLLDVLKTNLSIKRSFLLRYTTKRKLDKFIELFQKRRLTTCPIPIYPSKRDLVLLSAGVYPGHFHNQVLYPQVKYKGLAVYLDVSGSVNLYLPKILGILKHLEKEITTVFQFSNEVVETEFAELLKGNIETTIGTDFDCVASSILEKRFDKVVIITDGYAYLSDDLKEQLLKQRLITLTVVFDRTNSCESFEPFGDVIQLEHIVN